MKNRRNGIRARHVLGRVYCPNMRSAYTCFVYVVLGPKPRTVHAAYSNCCTISTQTSSSTVSLRLLPIRLTYYPKCVSSIPILIILRLLHSDYFPQWLIYTTALVKRSTSALRLVALSAPLHGSPMICPCLYWPYVDTTHRQSKQYHTNRGRNLTVTFQQGLYWLGYGWSSAWLNCLILWNL